jgi:quercetin dioxygenase-like cupin family protein
MFRKQADVTYRDLIDGVRLGTLVYGEKTLMGQFRLAKGSDLPLHHHPYEQTGYLISGRIILTIDGVDHEAGPGDSWCIGSDVHHRARAIEDSLVLEVFSPLREDYLPE